MYTRDKVKQEALKAFKNIRPNTTTDYNGYVNTFQENLLTDVIERDFVSELQAGDGRELDSKFLAVHSSAALVVNNFAPFKRNINDLKLPMGTNFNSLAFERKCSTGLRGTPPNIDVFIENESAVIGIESKFTEYLNKPKVVFSDAYDRLSHMDYFQEMKRVTNNPYSYSYLDVAQLIKCSYGLAHNFGRKKIFLLYLYWEPSNSDNLPSMYQEIFNSHKQDIESFAGRLVNTNPEFVAMNYNELWQFWRENSSAEWLSKHLDELEARYGFPVL